MSGSLNALIAATVIFVGGHFLLSSSAIRPLLIDRLGEGVFRGVYGVVMLASLVWMLLSYAPAEAAQLWFPPPAFAWIPLVVMPFAAILIVAGVTTPNPTMAGGERLLDDATGAPATGIITITRHPFLWGTGLWALSHLAVNGDLASFVLMGGVAVLSFAGMAHIDHRKEVSLGAAWGPMKLTTSRLPFAAILSGRCKPDWRGIGWWRPLVGLALYVGLLHLHVGLFGVSPLPY